MKNLLEIKHLNISFTQYYKGLDRRQIHVVKDLNLDLRQEEVLAIFGASGSGKSLLVHAILDLLPSNAVVTGNINYDGKPLTKQILDRVRGNEITFIPQTINSLNPLLKVGKQVRCTIRNKSKVVEIQEALFKKFGLQKEVGNMYPFELSGGMARKALVCTAMSNNAKLVIADEPTPGMDNIGLEETVNFFKSIPQKGGSAIIITHDIDTALKIADRIAIFYDGTIIEVANREDFSGNGQNLKHPYSKALWQALPQNGFNQPTKEELEEMKKIKNINNFQYLQEEAV